jgi:hypothetical protein
MKTVIFFLVVISPCLVVYANYKFFEWLKSRENPIDVGTTDE